MQRDLWYGISRSSVRVGLIECSEFSMARAEDPWDHLKLHIETDNNFRSYKLVISGAGERKDLQAYFLILLLIFETEWECGHDPIWVARVHFSKDKNIVETVNIKTKGSKRSRNARIEYWRYYQCRRYRLQRIHHEITEMNFFQQD